MNGAQPIHASKQVLNDDLPAVPNAALRHL
jgi:hypothetical protein